MLQTGPTVDDSEASSIATLLLGFQGGLGSLFDDLGAPEGFAGFHLSHEEQELLAADPVKYQRQSSGGSTVKRNRSTSKIAGFAPTPDFARTSFTSRSKSSKDLTNLLQDKLELLQRHIQQNELLRCRCGLLEKVVSSREAQIVRLQELKRLDASGGHMVDHVATGHMDPLAPLGLTIQTLRNMKAPELLARARSVMSNVGQQLMLAGPGQQEEEAVLGHTGRMLLLAGKYASLIREDGVLLSGRNVNESELNGEEDAFPDAERHWAMVVANLGLTPQQVMSAWVLLDLYSGWHRKVVTERAELSSRLAELLSDERKSRLTWRNLEDMPGFSESTLVDKLHSNVVRERCLMFLISEVFANHILTAVQVSKMVVHSYPRIPDEIAIISSAAALFRPIP